MSLSAVRLNFRLRATEPVLRFRRLCAVHSSSIRFVDPIQAGRTITHPSPAEGEILGIAKCTNIAAGCSLLDLALRIWGIS